MLRVALLCSLLSLLPGFSSARASDEDQPAALRTAQALERVMQEVIARVEPSVACILVSRSEAYQRLGLALVTDSPGRLGSFDAEAAERGLLARGLSETDRRELVRRLDLADATHVPEAYGSGIVLDEHGLILTNYHVVQGATKLFVRLPGGKSSYADIYAADPRSDLAVLKLLDRKLVLRAIPLGDGGEVKRGQFVLTIANPFAAGFRDGQPSASWGILSNIRRRPAGNLQAESELRTLHQYGNLLQTDARLNLGCSGGALVNLKGEMIGLTTALAAIQGGETPGGFALPLDQGMHRIVASLKRGEEVEYGFLGVRFEPRQAGSKGVPLSYVYPGSPADLAGLHPKDLILGVNGTTVHDTDDLLLALGVQLAGAAVRLDVLHPAPRKREQVEVQLAKYYVPGKKIASELGARPFFRGLRVDYTSLLAQQPWQGLLPRIPAGVLITDVQSNSAAANAFLKTGDIVTHVQGRVVNTPALFYETTRRVLGPVELTLAGSAPGQAAPKVTLP
jgi:S1-C subfamily serine protease